MRYLLDTNALASYLNPGDVPVKRRVASSNPNDIALCSVVKAELYFGARNSGRPDDNLKLLSLLFSRFGSLPFGDAEAEVYGRIRADLTRVGTPIGPNDLLIASIALANGLILVTHNVREFSRVTGLQVEDWEI